MGNENWDSVFTTDSDRYSIFVAKVKQKYESYFPLIQISRKRLKDKPGITKGLKISIKNNHRLYRRYLRENESLTNIRYKKYKNELRKCLKIAEEKYYNQLFDDTKHSAYNLWKNLGPVLNTKNIQTNCIAMEDLWRIVIPFQTLWANTFVKLAKNFSNRNQTLVTATYRS